MAIDKEFFIEGLLRYNYLPTTRESKEELPPIFDSRTFSPDVAQKLLSPEVNATKDERRNRGYDQIEYRLTRYNSVSRTLSIPHPTAHSRLCLSLHEHWEKFCYIAENPSSQIKPRENDDGRVIIMSGYDGIAGVSGRKLSNSFGKRYCVKTDISNCFPSIYSHAVAWGLVGRDEAKNQRNSHKEWFNKIDRLIRSSRRLETQGIAIGPGTSNVIAEIILARIDQTLRDKGYSFVRYIDDYECYCDSEEQAKNFIQHLERAASEYKLQLNIQKTKFTKLPQPVSDDWILELGQHAPKASDATVFDVYRFLDVAVCLAEKHPESNVLKYAASVIEGLELPYTRSADCLNYLITLAFHHTDLLPKLQKLIDASYVNFGELFLDLDGLNQKLDTLLNECATYRRSDGMCWALYYLGRVNGNATMETARKVLETEDSLAITALYWAGDEHRAAVIDFATALDAEDIHELDRHWLLLYQLYKDGQIPNPYKDDTCFDTLKDSGVHFLLPKQELAPKSYESGSEFA